MRRLIFSMLALATLALFIGCARAPQEAATSSNVPPALVKAAGGKVAFIEFYSPN